MVGGLVDPLRRGLFLILSFVCMLAPGSIRAQESPLNGNTDLSKVRPAPDVAPPPGAVLKGYHYWPSATTRVLLGPLAGDETRQRTLDGTRTLLFFTVPGTSDQAAIVRRYKDKVESEGGGSAFQCGDIRCGPPAAEIATLRRQLLGWFYQGSKDPLNPLIADEKGADITDWRKVVDEPMKTDTPGSAEPTDQTEFRVGVGRLPPSRGRGERYISVFTMNGQASGNEASAGPPNVDVLVEVAEASALSATSQPATADILATDLATDGHASVYSVYFDSDSAEMKPESAPTLEQIAILLRHQPTLRLLLVDHTDNHASYDFEASLSQKRADAIASTLARDFAIDPSRLRAVGDGMSAPVATNDTEAGSALNRRLELVKQ